MDTGLNRQHAIRGVYVITDAALCGAALLPGVTAALDGGASLLQYRNKSADRQLRYREAAALQEICGAYHVPFIINDDIELALQINADGVHLGQSDGDVAAARARLGARRILGVTCHDSLEYARRAATQGANYVAMGAVFPSPTKPRAKRVTLDVIRQARGELQLPIVAIGGINADNARSVVDSGASSVAVISAVFRHTSAEDIETAVIRLCKAIQPRPGRQQDDA